MCHRGGAVGVVDQRNIRHASSTRPGHQVIVYGRWDRSSDIIEDQVNDPGHHRVARRSQGQGGACFSDFGFTFTPSFEDGTDMYYRQPRARVPNMITSRASRREGELGRCLQRGLAFQYAGGQMARLDELVPYQTVPCATPSSQCPEVATVGARVRQYQAFVNPNTAGRPSLTRGARVRRATTMWAEGSWRWPDA